MKGIVGIWVWFPLTNLAAYIPALHSPSPMMPSVSPRIRAAPPATSLICSTLEARVPSLRAWCIQVTRLYRLRIRHSEVSAVSSTEDAGTLQTAMPAWTGGKGEGNINHCVCYFICELMTELQMLVLCISSIPSPSSAAALMSTLSKPEPILTITRRPLNFSKSSLDRVMVWYSRAATASFSTYRRHFESSQVFITLNYTYYLNITALQQESRILKPHSLAQYK